MDGGVSLATIDACAKVRPTMVDSSFMLTKCIIDVHSLYDNKFGRLASKYSDTFDDF